MSLEAGRRLMVIFSVGGLGLARRGLGSSRGLRCQPSVLTLTEAPEIVLDPFPDPAMTGRVGDGWARVLRGDDEVAARPVSTPLPRRRWDDVDVLAFAAATLSSWIILPAMLDHPVLTVRDVGLVGGLRRVEVRWPAAWPGPTHARHVLSLDSDGLVHRHEEGPLLHQLTGHCDFEGTIVATRRRTRVRIAGGPFLPVRWADVVAAHSIPERPRNSSTG